MITEHRIRHLLADPAAPTLDLPGLTLLHVGDTGDGPTRTGGEPTRLADDNPLAYVIFTSGSTGTPKGVMMRRAAVDNTLRDLAQRLRLGPADRVLALSDLGFDLSVFDLFATLMSGAALVLPSPAQRLDPSAWWQLCQQHRVTIWNSVPAYGELLSDYARNKLDRLGTLPLRWVLLSGDWIPLSLPAAVAQLAPGARLLSLGGATEAGIWSVAYPVTGVPPEWKSIPYGTPLAAQDCRIVDEHGEPCPDWVAGELLITGASLSDGYWHRPDLTAAAYFMAPDGERCYRTGDLARYRDDGVIELLGRIDTQVKVAGHRIDCLEVEQVIASHPQVRRVVVVDTPRAPGVELHAVIEADAAASTEALLAHCRQQLPDAMVPRRWHRAIPIHLSDNGKIDRRRVRDQVLASLRDAQPSEVS